MAGLTNSDIALEILIQADISQFKENMSSASQAITDFANDAKAVGQQMQYVSAAILGLATGAIYAAVKTDELRQALENVGGTGAAQFQQFTEDANKLGLGIEAVAKAAIKLEATGLTNETTRKLIDSVGEAVRKMGGGDQQFSSVINGLEMIAATGVLTNRSLRTIERTAPELKGAIEEAFGTDNTNKILALNLTVEQFMSKISDAASKISGHTRTIGDSFAELKNSVLVSMGSLGDTLVTDLHLVEALDWLSNAIKNAIKAFQDLDPQVKEIIEIFGAIMIAVGPILIMLPVLLALFNPIGIAIVAISALVAVMITYWDDLRVRFGYVVSAGYALRTAFEILLVPLVAVGGMVLRVAGLLLGGVKGFQAATEATDGWTKSLLNNIAVSAKKSEQIRDQTNDLIRLNAEFDKEAAVDAKIAGTDAAKTAPNAGGNQNVLHGANSPKIKAIKEEREVEVKSLFDMLEAEQTAQQKFDLEQRQRRLLAMGVSMQDIKQYSANYLATVNQQQRTEVNLATNTGEALLRITKKNQEESDAAFRKGLDAMRVAAKQVNDFVSQSVISLTTNLTSGIVSAFQSGDWTSLGKSMLSAVGSIMVQLGGMCLAAGIGIKAVKDSLQNPLGGGVTAIIAGIALIAIGSVFSAAASGLGSGGGGGGSVSAAATSSGGSTGPDANLAALQKMSTNSQMSLTTQVSGANLNLVLSRYNQNSRS